MKSRVVKMVIRWLKYTIGIIVFLYSLGVLLTGQFPIQFTYNTLFAGILGSIFLPFLLINMVDTYKDKNDEDSESWSGKDGH